MTSPHRPAPTRILYITLVAVSAIGPLALNIFMPSIPGLIKEFNTSSGMAQLTLTLYLIGGAFSQLIYGPLSDRFGRRPLVLAGMAIYVIASVACALSTTIEGLIVARLFQSFGGAAGMVLSRAIIRDLHDERASASVLGYITMAWVVVPMLAPTLGGYIDEVGTWRTSFWILSALGAMATILAVATLPETNTNIGVHSGQSRWKEYGQLFSSKRFVILIFTLSFSSAMFFSFLGGAPFITIKVLGLSPLDYGKWFIPVSIGYMTGNFLSGRFSQQYGTRKMITFGLMLTLAAATTIMFFALTGNLTAPLFFLPMAFATMGNGICLPNANAAVLSVNTKVTGSAAGLSGFTGAIAGAIAAQLVGIIQPSIPLSGIYFIFASALLASISYLIMGRGKPAH